MVTIVVIMVLIAVVVGAGLWYRNYRSTHGSRTFKRVMNNNPNFSPKLMDTYVAPPPPRTA